MLFASIRVTCLKYFKSFKANKSGFILFLSTKSFTDFRVHADTFIKKINLIDHVTIFEGITNKIGTC